MKRWLRVLSAVYLAGAIVLLVCVCGLCCPSLGGTVRQMLAGRQDSPLREAFSIMAEGLEAGEPVREVFSDSAKALFGDAASD